MATLKEDTTTYTFTYDALGRLTKDFGGQTFAYDAMGRITNFRGTSYTHNSNHPLHAAKSGGGYTYAYDANGNRTSAVLPPVDSTGYTWDAENRLQSVQTNGVTTESYVYDIDGNRIKETAGSVITYTYFPGVYEEIVNGGTTTALKHYSFNGMAIATRKGTALRYVHTDHLSSTSVETSDNGSQQASRTYHAYGAQRGGGSTLQTDRTFTGQKQDGTGLLYYNARYYNPTHCVFLSPDSTVPNPERIYGYNRFMYTYGNPLKYTDPSGHETSKPDWWPPYLPYVFDLPDDMTYDEFVEWAQENSVPTSFSGQLGGVIAAGFFGGGQISIEVQGTINWLSGEYMLSLNDGGGFRAGTPVNGVGLNVGGTVHYHASNTAILQDSSLYSSVDGYIDTVAKAGVVATYARAVEYADTNGNAQFDLFGAPYSEGVRMSSVRDPIFDQPVESLSVDGTIGVDVTPNVVDGGISAGIKDTNRLFTLDLYRPFRWLFD